VVDRIIRSNNAEVCAVGEFGELVWYFSQEE